MPELLRLDAGRDAELRDLLFEHGVEFPCNGDSLCGGCCIRVLEGDIPITDDMRDALTERELAAGWRLGCQAQAHGPVVVEVEQWSVRILTDEARLPFEPVDGYGMAIDVGTTTLVAQLVDLRTGEIVGVETALNPQCRYGADVMTRIQYDLEQPGILRGLIRETLGAMIESLARGRPVREALLCGNTVMHHLFCGEDVEPLSHVPFRSQAMGARRFTARELNWPASFESGIAFLPCIGGFVGSDLLAGLIVAGLADADAPLGLLDLGTNGEIAIGDRNGIVCASTAAGPAFEGGRIQQGMRAGTGAIDRVTMDDRQLRPHIIGGGPARGICGSGLVDAVAGALELGQVNARGRIVAPAKEVALDAKVALTQSDIRELQLAKGAIRAGLELLATSSGRVGFSPRLLLAGAFGNYLRIESARRIGLFPPRANRIEPAGNTALRGTRMLLLAPRRRCEMIDAVLARTRHVELASNPEFQNVFVERMWFD